MSGPVEQMRYVGGGTIVASESFVPSTKDTLLTSPSGMCISPMGSLMFSDHRHRGVFVIEGGRTHVLATNDGFSEFERSDSHLGSLGLDTSADSSNGLSSHLNQPQPFNEAEEEAQHIHRRPGMTIQSPYGIVCLKDGSTLVADMHTHMIMKIKQGRITSFAGTGTKGGMDGKFSDASFSKPKCLSLTPRGDLLVTEVGSHRIRLLIMEYGGVVVTVAGEGPKGYKEGPAAFARFSHPSGICCVRLDPSLMYMTYRPIPKDDIAIDESRLEGDKFGKEEKNLNPTVGTPLESENDLEGDMDKYDDLLIFVSDTHNHRVRMIHNGTVSSVAGNGRPGLADGPGNLAQFDHPMNVCMSYHAILVADNRNNRIRRIDLDTDLVSTICILNDQMHDLVLERPSMMALNEAGELFVALEFESHAEVHQVTQFMPPYGWPSHGRLLSMQERMCATETDEQSQQNGNDENGHLSTSAEIGEDIQHQFQGLHDTAIQRSSESSGHIRMLIAKERSKSVDSGIAPYASQSRATELLSSTANPPEHLLHDFAPEQAQAQDERPWGLVSKLTRMLSLDENKMMQRMDSLLGRLGIRNKEVKSNYPIEKTSKEGSETRIDPDTPQEDVTAQPDNLKPSTPTKESKKERMRPGGKLAAEDSDVDSDEIVAF